MRDAVYHTLSRGYCGDTCTREDGATCNKAHLIACNGHSNRQQENGLCRNGKCIYGTKSNEKPYNIALSRPCTRKGRRHSVEFDQATVRASRYLLSTFLSCMKPANPQTTCLSLMHYRKRCRLPALKGATSESTSGTSAAGQITPSSCNFTRLLRNNTGKGGIQIEYHVIRVCKRFSFAFASLSAQGTCFFVGGSLPHDQPVLSVPADPLVHANVTPR